MQPSMAIMKMTSIWPVAITIISMFCEFGFVHTVTTVNGPPNHKTPDKTSGTQVNVPFESSEFTKSSSRKGSVVQEPVNNGACFVMLTLGEDAFSQECESMYHMNARVVYDDLPQHIFDERFICTRTAGSQTDSISHARIIYQNIVESFDLGQNTCIQRVFVQFPPSCMFSSDQHFESFTFEFLNNSGSRSGIKCSVFVPKSSEIYSFNELFSVLYSPLAYQHENGFFECLRPSFLQLSVFNRLFALKENMHEMHRGFTLEPPNPAQCEFIYNNILNRLLANQTLRAMATQNPTMSSATTALTTLGTPAAIQNQIQAPLKTCNEQDPTNSLTNTRDSEKQQATSSAISNVTSQKTSATAVSPTTIPTTTCKKQEKTGGTTSSGFVEVPFICTSITAFILGGLLVIF